LFVDAADVLNRGQFLFKLYLYRHFYSQ
jgi:hypothetical protein